MVASNIPIDLIYLDGSAEDIIVGAVTAMQDRSETATSDDGSFDISARWDRRKRQWTAGWALDVTALENLFEVNGTSRGFVFISPRLSERVATNQEIGTFNQVTRTHALTNGVQTVFQLQVTAATSAWAVARDVLYPLPPDIAPVIVIKLDAAIVDPSLYTIDYEAGTATFTVAPVAGKNPKATFHYGWPVSITSDTISTTLYQLERKEVRQVVITEVF